MMGTGRGQVGYAPSYLHHSDSLPMPQKTHASTMLDALHASYFISATRAGFSAPCCFFNRKRD